MNKIKFIFIACVLIFTACKKNVSPIVILVSQYDSNIVDAGSIVTYHIDAFSNQNTIQKITLTTIDSERGTQVVWDTLLNTKKTNFNYSYRVPFFTKEDLTRITLTFSASSTSGEETQMTSFLYVKKGGSLRSYDGIIMYSSLSNGRNGFNISNAQTLYTSTADSASIDIYDYFDPSIGDSSLLCREWRSMTGTLFVRFNDFDFANATIPNLQSAYESGAKYTSISDIQVGDIILVGSTGNNTASGVIQITAIYDEEGTNNDRYIFNFKKP